MNPKHRQQSETQNLVIAMVLSMLVLFYWEYYIEAPRQKAEIAAVKAKQAAEAQTQTVDTTPAVIRPREQILSDSPRLPIDSPSLHGSIALKGLRFDDLTFTRYRETLAPDSPPVTLFSPADDVNSYFAEFGWLADSKTLKVPGPDAVWAADAKELAPGTPVSLSWKSPDNVTFTVKVAMDEKYLFTITQIAVGADGKPIALQSYGYINRIFDTKKNSVLGIIHEGPIGAFDNSLKEATYKKLAEEKEQTFKTEEGWLGMSDKYWLSTIIPEPQSFTANFSYYNSRGRDHYQVDYQSAVNTQTVLHFFAGAKELNLLEAYQAQYHIPLFERAVDYGYFYWLAEPLFHLLSWFYSLVGNFGVAILLLTVVVKLCLYPLATKSFISMNQMKVLQPRMKEIQERFKDDKMQMNQAIMELYKREKVNPASGCLPIFIQLPVFISLYKVLYVSIEMRHAAFFGWIHDLSAPDPTNLFTLFGLIPWMPPFGIHLGAWPILMCATMIIQQRQSPPPADPTQAKMIKFMPFIFLFMFSGVAAGLAIYWSWSNTLSILQQWHIKRTHGGDRRKLDTKPDAPVRKR